MLLTLLLNNKNLIAGLIFISVLGAGYAYIRVLKSENAALVAEKVTLSTQLESSQATMKQLQSNIEAQNTAIDKLKKDADVREARHDQEVKAAQASANTYKQKAADLLKRQAATNVPLCDAANSLINEEISNARK